jgi:two-component system sensor histidine kinase PrrB
MSRPLSIRARVTIAATLAVAFVLIAGGVATVATFAQRERSSLDRELEQRAHGPAGRVELLRRAPLPGAVRAAPPQGGDVPGEPGGEQLPRGGPPRELLAESGSFVRVIRGGTVVQAAGDVPGQGFPAPKRPGFDTVESAGGTWRTLTVEPSFGPPGEPTAETGAFIQFASDLDPVENRIGSLRERVALIAALGIVLAAILANLLARPALDPLSRLRRSVAGISGTRDLSRRLPDAGAAHEANELARSVNGMLARLERSSAETEDALEATRRFAADVGHEVRTPLTSIRANLDALRRNPSMPEAERRGILEEVAHEQIELVALLDALQALARGDAGTALPRQQLDFAEIVDAAVEAARRRHPAARIQLSGPEDRQDLNGWPDGLRLLVDNLLENAVRHGGSRVDVQVGREANEGREAARATAVGPTAGTRIVLEVCDDGPGVPADDRQLIFQRFARGSAVTAPGSGLGLALVAQQAALHGGEVVVGDSPSGGACFTVRLPSDGGKQLGAS